MFPLALLHEHHNHLCYDSNCLFALYGFERHSVEDVDLGLTMPGRYLELDEKAWNFGLPIESVPFDVQTFQTCILSFAFCQLNN